MTRAQKFSRLHSSTILTSAMLAMALGNSANAAPVGGAVVAGQASIANAGAITNITQSSSRALIEWNKFDVHSGETVNFIQPGKSSIALNRVVNSLSASQINGAINANGNVIIVNSQGVMFGAGAQVNVGGLIATTADIDNDRFMNGDLNFDRAGNPNATISNSGAIKIADGGLALLVGPNVTNDGLIQANLGTVQLASGDSFTVDLYGDGLLSLQASDALNKQLVENKGKIAANGGKVLLTAAAAKNTVQSLINMNGLIQANSVSKRGGKVVLSAAGSNKKGTQAKAGSSEVNVSGTIEARGGNGSEQGGQIAVLGDNVAILRNSRLDASGNEGGGVVLVGGDYKGEGAIQTAVNVLVEAGSKILANAIEKGDGGKVIVWSDIDTVFGGHIEAKGGAQGGNGGFVETSGKEYLDAFGSVDASALNGNAGTWLLDPRNVTITSSSTSNGTYASHTFTPTGNNSTVNVSSIVSSLNGGNNVVVTTGSTGTQDGNITVATDISKTSGGNATLTLSAANDIIFNSNIDVTSTSNRLNVVLHADNDSSGGGAVLLDDGSSIVTNGGNITIGGGLNPLTTAAIGNNNSNSGRVIGVEIDDATLNAGGGNISIRGTGYATSDDGNYGVYIHDGAVVQTSGSGTITIVGQGGGTGSSDHNYGVAISGNNSRVSARDGAISITGTGGGSNSSSSDSNYGFLLDNNASVTSTGSGPITITGTAGGNNNTADDNFGIRFSNGTNTIGGGSATGAINLVADTISLSNNLSVTTNSGVVIRPITNSTSIGIAGAAGTLQVTSALLNSIAATNVTVGSTAVTGALTANAHSWNAPAILLTGSGNIALNGVQTMGARGFLAYTASGDITIGASGGVSSTATGRAVILAASGGDFINSRGAAALSTPNGSWLIYSTAPANNTLNGLTSDFFRYSCTYGGACPSFPSTGNGLLYSSSPSLVLTINPDAKTILYGQAAPTFTYTLSGYAGGDAATDVVTGAPVISTNYAQGNNVGSYNITTAAGTLNSSLGYSFTGTTLVNGLTVNKKDLTITANNQTKVYGSGNTLTAGFSSSGLYSSETIGSVNLATNATSSTSGNWNAGSWSITPSAATGGTFNPNNYNITYTPGTLTINKRDLTVTAVASNKDYDGNTTATVTLSDNRINGDLFDVTKTSATFDTKNVGTGKTVTVSGIGVSGTDANNYSPNSTTTALANINKASLSITANDQNQTYGDGNIFTAGFSSSGLATGETIGSVTLSTNATNSTSGNWKAGTWSITPSAATGGTFSASNYAITYVNGILNIARRALAVTAAASNKQYDGNTTATVTLSNNRITNDVLTVSRTGANFDNKNVGTGKTVTVTGISISGTDAGNYTPNTTTTALADITKAPLTIRARNQLMTYGGGNLLTEGFTTTGLKGGDTVGSVALATNATSSTSGNWNAGSWSITPSAATGGTFSAGNYNITYTNGALTILRRLLLVSADAQDKVYDGNTTAIVTLSDNRITNDVLTANYGSANFINKNVGDNKLVTVTGISISGADAGNYLANTFALSLADITRAALSITANNQSQTYGDGNNLTAGFSSSGLATGETIGSVTLATDATSSTSGNWKAGDWAITPSAATGGTFNTSNYTITYTAGTLHIDRKNLTVSAVAADKTYDGNRTASVTLSNDAIALDAVDNAYTTARFGNKNAGTNKTVTVNGISISGADADNYTLTSTTATDLADIFKRDLLISVVADDKEYDGDRVATVTLFDDRVAGDTFNTQTYSTARFDTRHVGVDKTVTVEGIDISGGDARNYNFNTTATDLANITAKALTIDANNQTQTYGDGNVLTQGVTATGLVIGEDLGTVDLATDATNSTSGNWNAGDWTITASNAQNNGRFRTTNYAITYTTGDLHIGRKDLTVSAVADNKEYNGNRRATVTLSNDAIALDVVDNDYTRARFNNRHVGVDKTVTVSGISIAGTDAANYNLLNTTATDLADITAKALTIDADDQTQTYGDGNLLTEGVTATGLVSGESLGTVDLATDATNSTSGNWNAGDWTITASNAQNNGRFRATNYTITYTTGNLTIDKKSLAVTAAADNKVYDGNTTATVTLSDDRISGDLFDVTNSSATFDNKNVGTDKTVTVSGISISGTDAANYTQNTSTTDLADITPANLTITANDQNQTYGDGNLFTAGFASSGLQGSDAIDDVDFDTDATFSSSKNWNAGSWTITPSNATGAEFLASNYSITYLTGTLTIDKKSLAVTAAADNKVYDGNTTATVTLSDDRISGDLFDVTNSSATFDNKNVGTDKTVTVSGISISGTDAANYTQNESTTDLADITQATLSVDANDQTKVYGSADPSLTFSYSGFVTGDDESLFTGGLERLPGETVVGGPYDIMLGSLSAGGNYAISYTGGTLSITPYTLGVTANELRKTYGTSDPTLTFTFGTLQNGDDISVFTGSLARTAGENVAGSPYEINIGTLGAGSNYVLDFTGASFFIDPATLFVAANNQSIRMGQNIPALTYRITGLAFDDTASVLSGGLETVPERSLPGFYPITQGSLVANSNYVISYTPGTIQIRSPFDVNNSSEQTSEFNSSNFQGPQGQNILLSMTGGSTGGGSTGGAGGLGNLSPAAGGGSSGGFDPSSFGNLSPAAGGNNPQGLGNLNPSAGSSSGGGQTGGQTIALIECNEQNPCDVSQ